MTIAGFVQTFGKGSFSSINLARLASNNLEGDIKEKARDLIEAEAKFMGCLIDNNWPNEKVDKHTLSVLANYEQQLTNYSDGF